MKYLILFQVLLAVLNISYASLCKVGPSGDSDNWESSFTITRNTLWSGEEFFRDETIIRRKPNNIKIKTPELFIKLGSEDMPINLESTGYFGILPVQDISLNLEMTYEQFRNCLIQGGLISTS